MIAAPCIFRSIEICLVSRAVARFKKRKKKFHEGDLSRYDYLGRLFLGKRQKVANLL